MEVLLGALRHMLKEDTYFPLFLQPKNPLQLNQNGTI
jgi:hypothetical protein